MIEAASLSLHQDIAFMIKSDMADHQIMQSIMRQVARDFVSADSIAASLQLHPTMRSEELQSGGLPLRNVIDVLLQGNRLNYPLALQRGLERFGWQKYRDEKPGRYTDHKDEMQQDIDATGLTDDEISIFHAIDQLLPRLQDEGLCSGVQLGLYQAPPMMSSFWSNNLIVVLLPIDGQLGQRQALFTYLLRRGFEPRSIQGKVVLQSGSLIQPLPLQELNYTNAPELVAASRLVIEKQSVQGKSFLLGLIEHMPPARHWLDLDHRDLDT